MRAEDAHYVEQVVKIRQFQRRGERGEIVQHRGYEKAVLYVILLQEVPTIVVAGVLPHVPFRHRYRHVGAGGADVGQRLLQRRLDARRALHHQRLPLHRIVIPTTAIVLNGKDIHQVRRLLQHRRPPGRALALHHQFPILDAKGDDTRVRIMRFDARHEIAQHFDILLAAHAADLPRAIMLVADLAIPLRNVSRPLRRLRRRAGAHVHRDLWRDAAREAVFQVFVRAKIVVQRKLKDRIVLLRAQVAWTGALLPVVTRGDAAAGEAQHGNIQRVERRKHVGAHVAHPRRAQVDLVNPHHTHLGQVQEENGFVIVGGDIESCRQFVPVWFTHR
ncbi:MAG: hypothetical protein BWY76_03418 [bacterium ADurb.Bin429]|nr:MAG: hypothetical protein BWY76_03418 [bacterium ADurb.Bin429]